MLCCEARLQERIRFERSASFGRRLDPEIALRREIETQRRHELRQLTELAAVAARQNDGRHLTRLKRKAPQATWRLSNKRLCLEREQLSQAGGSQVEHRIELIAPKSMSLGGALDLDERPAIVHDDVHVGFRV
jgi:hypothetical protein